MSDASEQALLWEKLYHAVAEHAEVNRSMFELLGRSVALKSERYPDPAMMKELNTKLEAINERRDVSLLRLHDARAEYEKFILRRGRIT